VTEASAVETDAVVARVQEAFGDRIRAAGVDYDQPWFVVARADLRALAAFLRDDPALRFTRLVDLCGVDYLTAGPALPHDARFEVVVHLHSFPLRRWARIRVPVPEDDPVVPSLTPEWPAANWFEREAYDMFGIRFTDHPDLTRILTPDDWEVHPLRKDFQPPREPHEWSFNPEEWQKAVQRGS